MSKFHDLIAQMKSVDYPEKRQFLHYLAQMAEREKRQFAPADKDALLAYAYEEVDRMLSAIRKAETYKEKDIIFECEDYLLGMVMHLTGSPANIPEDKLMRIRALAETVDQERRIETTLDAIWEQAEITRQDITRLLFWVRQCTDEYQKSKLFQGLVHYQIDMAKLNDDARRMLTEYIGEELRRLMSMDTEDTWNALELVADVSKHFADEAIIADLLKLVQLGRNHINFYALGTLCAHGAQIPQSVIDALALDLEYACLTYHTLEQHCLASRFPAEYATEEYLAKSDLVRWLTYPTELGKVPDEIVYIGKIKQFFKKEVFHVFKFRSDSDTLDDAQKNKWLIGWSSNEGGTFSNFDEFAPYESLPTEKALKLIKKNIIG